MRRQRRRAVGALFVAALACGRAEPEAEPEVARGGPPAAAPAAPAEAGGAELPLPPKGQVQVSFGSEGILALANQAPRRRVLESIARETGLLVVAFVEGGDPEGRVTLRSRGEPIEVVVARALPGVPFSIEPLEAGRRERLAVVVGKRDATGRPRPVPPRPLAEPRQRPERPPAPDTEALEQIASADPEERVEGVEWADVASAAGYAAVVDRLANDPDAAVRAAAAESLGDADVGAVPPLLAALEDRDPRVVLAALESLEMLGDASTIPEVTPFLEHPDPAVRERAAEVIEFLE